MWLGERIPGVRTERPLWNLVVGLGYLFVLPVIVTAVTALLPLAMLVAVGTNARGWGDRIVNSGLGRLPGVSSPGWSAGVALCSYLLLGYAIVGASTGVLVFPGAAGIGDKSTDTAPHPADPAPSAGDASNGTARTGSHGQTPTGGTGEGTTSESAGVAVTVTRVVDGDTVEVRYRNGTNDTARLLGVDTPEIHVENSPDEFEGIPDTEAGRSCLRGWGHNASEYARQHLDGEQVRLTLDGNEPRRGAFDRLLVYVYHDGVLFNDRLVEQGYSRVYDSTFTKRDHFEAAESIARLEGRGLWACRNASASTPPSSSSNGSGPLRVVEINADAPGNDHENRNGEYVVFENTADERLALAGWRIEDGAGHTYVVPEDVALSPDERVTLYTGQGTDTDEALYWGSDVAVWDNDGDMIVVYDDSGTRVIEHEYP